jgi:DNA-binding GntR family transcriptional regulator
VTPKLERPTPVYAQVVDALRTKITDGQLREGDLLPSVRSLADEWGIATTTAAKVHSALRAEGLAKTVPGVGTAVAAQAKDLGQPPEVLHRRANRTGKMYPPNQYGKIIAAEVTTAPDHVADALGLEPGSEVIRRQRVTYEGQRPIAMSTSWYPGELAEDCPKLAEPGRMEGGTAGYVAERTGRTGTHGCDRVAGRLASAEVAQLLGLKEGDAVLAGNNWLYDEAGDVLEFGEYFHPSARWSSYSYSL